MTDKETKVIDLGKDLGEVTVTVNGKRIEIGADGTVKAIHPVADATKKALKVGDRISDGTVVLSVDLEENIAVFVPQGIFGGSSGFDDQDSVVKAANAGKGLHGHTDWRGPKKYEVSSLLEAWNKVAPRNMQGHAAPYFWSATPISVYKASTATNPRISTTYEGAVLRAGMNGSISSKSAGDGRWDNTRPVPVFRSGPARI